MEMIVAGKNILIRAALGQRVSQLLDQYSQQGKLYLSFFGSQQAAVQSSASK